jgi:hypothetical protein
MGIPSARAGDDGAPETSIRAEMLSEYHYAGKAAAANPAPAPSPAPAAAPLASAPAGDVVRLPSYIVFDSRQSEALGGVVKAQEADSRHQAIMDRLGIGVKTVPVGKHFAMGVVRVFYVPILVFGGFSW